MRALAAAVLVTVVMLISPLSGRAQADSAPEPCTRVLAGSQERPGPSAGAEPGDPAASSTGSTSPIRGAPSGSLASTGIAGLGMTLAGLSLLLVGAVCTLAPRYRRGATALLIGLALLAGTSIVSSSSPAGAQSVGADGCPSDPAPPTDPGAAPPPVVPETPLPVLLPALGVALTGGLLMTSRRRRPLSGAARAPTRQASGSA